MSQEQRSTISGNVWQTYTSASQQFKEGSMPRIGQVVCFEDGRRFTFCSSVLAHAVGVTVAAPALNASAVAGIHAIGTKEIILTEAAITANQYQNGTVTFAGGGTYKIKSNTATAGGTITLTLYDCLVLALADTAVADLLPLRNGNVIVGTASTDIIGVTNQAVDGTTSAGAIYFWAQTAGLCSVVGSAVAVGLAIMQAAAGAVAAADGTLAQLGYIVSDNGTSSTAMLTLDQVL
jgi:hypothetical protein